MPAMITTAVTAAATNNIDARSGCCTVAALEKAVVTIGRVGLVLVCIPCNISFVPSFLVDIGTTIVSEQFGHAIFIPAISRSYTIC